MWGASFFVLDRSKAEDSATTDHNVVDAAVEH